MPWPALPIHRPLAIAHRGASGELLENTLPAITRAIELGADGVEIDVQLSADGQVMVFHDHDLARLARRPDQLCNLTAAQLTQVDLVNPVDPAHRTYRMPTLAQVLQACHGRARVDIELKTDDPALVEAVLAEVRANDFSEHAYLTSFNPHYLQAMAAKAPDLWIGYLIALEEQLPDLMASPYVGACIPMWLASEATVAALRERGKFVVVWTVNNLDDIYRCMELDVDAVVSNFPDRVIKARDLAAGHA